MTSERIRAAEFEVERARGKLLATLGEVTGQLEPHRLMREVWDSAKVKGADLAEEAVDAVSKRPVATGAIIAGIAAFIAREPLFALATRLVGGAKDKRRTGKLRKTAAKPTQTETVE